MYEIEFKKEGVGIRKRINDKLLGMKTIEEKYTYDELSKMNDLELKVKMPIKPVIKNGVLTSIVMKIVELIEPTFIETESDEISNERGNSKGIEVPERVEKQLRERIFPRYIKQYAYRRYKKGTQACLIAEIIKERGEINDRELRTELQKRGYSGTGGSIGATIKVLKEVTREIRVEGRGEGKKYHWIGE